MACSGHDSPGEMVALQDGAVVGSMEWKATNCLYTGWTTLLAASGQKIKDMESWHLVWHQSEGDEASPTAWRPVADQDLAEVPAARYRTAQTTAWFAATSGAGALG